MTDQKNLQALTNERLHHLIEETQKTLFELKQELRRRIEEEQHEAIDHLEDYMEQAELSLKTFRSLLKALLKRRNKE